MISEGDAILTGNVFTDDVGVSENVFVGNDIFDKNVFSGSVVTQFESVGGEFNENEFSNDFNVG